jgi:hypothetical protein
MGEDVPEEEEVVEAEEVEEEVKEDVEMSYATKEELAEVISMIDEIKAMLEPKEEEPKEELKEEVELSAIPEEVSNELSQPAAEPINTSAEVGKMEVKFKVAANRRMSTLDRVMNKLNK